MTSTAVSVWLLMTFAGLDVPDGIAMDVGAAGGAVSFMQGVPVKFTELPAGSTTSTEIAIVPSASADASSWLTKIEPP